MTPIWVNPNQGVVLNPPAEVMRLGDQRSAENLIAAALALHVEEAKRYQPTVVTFCNIFAADWCQILKAPLPHVFDLGDGKGKREVRANDLFDALSAKPSKFPGWTETGTIASALAVKNLAAVGIPQVAIWKNPIPGHPGHIVGIIPKPPGKIDKPGFSGIWCAAAGAHCSNGCPIEEQYGHLLNSTKFFAFNGS